MTVMVHLRHIRKAHLCRRGAAAWFAQYGFSWDDFLDNGLSADTLDATGDDLAHKVTALARKETTNG